MSTSIVPILAYQLFLINALNISGGGPQSGRGQVEEAHHGQPVAQAEGERQAEGTTNGRQAGLLQRMAMLRPGMNAKLTIFKLTFFKQEEICFYPPWLSSQ